jgi:Mn-containing catalase
MYHHVKKLMYTVSIGAPDPRFGNMLLEQFGGANGVRRLPDRKLEQRPAAEKQQLTRQVIRAGLTGKASAFIALRSGEAKAPQPPTG